MLQLIIKDFRVYWLYLLLSLVIQLAASAVIIANMLIEKDSADPGIVIYFVLVMLVTSMSSLLFIKVDEIYNTDEVYASLPVNRKQMVKAKYTTFFLLILLGLIVHFLGAQLGMLVQGGFGNPELELLYKPQLWLVILILLLLFNSYSAPFYFMFGVSIGVLVVGIIQFLLLVLFVYIKFNHYDFWDDFQNLMRWVMSQNQFLTLTSLIGFYLLFTAGSLAFSIKAYKNKDL